MEAAWNVPGLAVEVLVWRAGGYNTCDWRAIQTDEGVVCSGLLRDIFGNLFRPLLPVSPAWLAWSNCTIPRLAEAAYNERQYPAGTLDVARLAVLADALEEAGCDDAGLVGHLRSEGPHVRGCWAIDLVLAKE
jgi:hypothetical protein